MGPCESFGDHLGNGEKMTSPFCLDKNCLLQRESQNEGSQYSYDGHNKHDFDHFLFLSDLLLMVIVHGAFDMWLMAD